MPKQDVRVYRPGDPDYDDYPSNEQYDQIEYGYRTPDGREHFGYPAWLQYTADKTDLSTEKGQALAQSKFEKAVTSTGVKYDPEVHGRLEFLFRVRQVRFTGSVPLFPDAQKGE